jgi:cysteine-rich repeat protein
MKRAFLLCLGLTFYAPLLGCAGESFVGAEGIAGAGPEQGSDAGAGGEASQEAGADGAKEGGPGGSGGAAGDAPGDRPDATLEAEGSTPDADAGAKDGDAGAKDADAEPSDGDAAKSDADAASEAEAGGFCGDGVVNAGEECDDGNTVAKDGCEGNCKFTCHLDIECPDNDPCTRDACSQKGTGMLCDHPIEAGATCDDGNPCTKNDQCDAAGQCTPGQNTCACQSTADCAPKEDGDKCNGTLICQNYECVVDPVTVVKCSTVQDTACKKNLCDKNTGLCGMQAVNPGAQCDDGRWCTVDDRCDNAGACAGTGSPCAYTCQTCDEPGHKCDVAAGKCLITGGCYAGDDSMPGNACRACLPAKSQTQWSARASGVACDNGNFCDGVDNCDGQGSCKGAGDPCPVAGCVGGCDATNGKCLPASKGTVCRSGSAVCELDATCDGASTQCPATNPYAPSTTVCRTSKGACDLPDRCTGTSAQCPADAKSGSGTPCRASAGICDLVEFCDGVSDACPADAFRASSYECRKSSGDCDVAEFCPGNAAACPNDTFKPATQVCRAAAGVCDVEEKCTGGSATCPNDVLLGPTTTCRQASPANQCDAAEVCSGTSALCPADGYKTPGTTCDDSNACTTADQCDLSGACKGTHKAPNAPQPLAPLNGGYVSTTPTLVWRPPVSDGCADAITYQVQVDDDCTSPTSCTLPSPVTFNSISGTSVQVTPALSISVQKPVGRRYYWRVRAWRNGVSSSWSPVRYMDVGRVPGDFNGDGFSDVAVGADQNSTDATGKPNRGIVYIYYGSSTGISTYPSEWKQSLTDEEAYFGYAVAQAGDVNADGYGDLLIGAPIGDGGNGTGKKGMAYLYLGTSGGVATGPAAKMSNPGGTANGMFGAAVAGVGDTNGDGWADWVVGAPFNGTSKGGAAYVYLGWTFPPESPNIGIGAPEFESNAEFGTAVAGGGDVNGDGFSDLIIGAPAFDHGVTNQGNAFVFYGSASSVPTSFSVRLEAGVPQASARFGTSVAIASDMNRDYFHDVFVGAPGYDVMGPDDGIVYGFRGAPAGLGTTPVWVLTDYSAQAGANHGNALAASGDVDGDGIDDLLIGGKMRDNPESNEGNAYVYRGSSSGPTLLKLLDNPEGDVGAQFGSTVACVGDVNGDGRYEIAIGAPYQDSPEGAVFFYPTPTGAPTKLTRVAPLQGIRFGSGVGSGHP